MPPPIGSQGSRTALVTWSVVFAFLFMTASVLAIYFYADASKSHDREDALRKQYTELAELAATKNVLLPVGTDYTPPNKWLTAIHRDWSRSGIVPCDAARRASIF